MKGDGRREEIEGDDGYVRQVLMLTSELKLFEGGNWEGKEEVCAIKRSMQVCACLGKCKTPCLA